MNYVLDTNAVSALMKGDAQVSDDMVRVHGLVVEDWTAG